MFYQGLHIAYAVLLCAALWFNRACWRTLVLSALLGAELMLVIPWVWPTWVWYLEWFIVEMLVIVAALLLRSPASRPVALFSVVLGFNHLLGAYFGPSDSISPYRVVQPMLETAQLLVCIALSHSAREYTKRQLIQALTLRGRNE